MVVMKKGQLMGNRSLADRTGGGLGGASQLCGLELSGRGESVGAEWDARDVTVLTPAPCEEPQEAGHPS